MNNLLRTNASQIQDDEEIRKMLFEKYKQLQSRYPSMRDEVQRAQENSFRQLHPPDQNGVIEGSLRCGTENNTLTNREVRPESAFSLDVPMSVPIPPATINTEGAATPIPKAEESILNEYCSEEDLRILRHKAQHPQYVDIQDRLQTFETWIHQSQNPKTIAQAGFYYTGNEDRVRCFMCNGGLCNFETDDIPWFEHHKWFGNCPYLQKCSENPVVAAIIDTARRMNDTSNVGCSNHNHGSGQTECDKNSSSSIVQDVPSNVSKEDEKEETYDSGQNGSCSLDGVNPAVHVAKDIESLRQENESLRTVRTCKVCMEQDVSIIFLPCRHLVCCLQCSVQVQECPICRSQIKATAKVIL